MNTPILILGMHRSGTSALAGSLEEKGLYLPGASHAGSAHNQKGNCENHKIVIFHETVLKYNGGNWRQPPETVIWEDRHRARANEFLEEMTIRGAPSGFKDPRTILHLEHWEKQSPVKKVGIFRHPIAVALSLQKRDQISLEEGIKLWEHYNQKLADHYQRQPFPLINYDLAPDSLNDSVTAAARQLGLAEWNNISSFFDSSLQHNLPRNNDMPESSRLIYNSLLEASDR